MMSIHIGLIVDQDNNLIIFGTSYSFDFPTGLNAPQSIKRGGTDLIVTKLSDDGSTMIGSTYIGGTANDGLNESSATKYFYSDDFRGEVNIDSSGRILVATTTASVNFPVTTGVFQDQHQGGQEGVVLCVSPQVDNVIWASYFGGSRDDAIYSIDVSQNGDLYISGGTASNDLSNASSSFGPSYKGGRADGFVARIKNDGSTLMRTAYWGTSRYDQILQLEIDKYGSIFVVGQSDGGMPTKGPVYKNGNSGQFISKFDADLENVLLSTVYGSGKNVPDITINAFLVDQCDKIFISGWGGSLYFGPQAKLANMPITPNALQAKTDGNDFHLAVFRKNMSDLVYGTYFGGNLTDDHVDGGTSRFDKLGVIYQSVCSSCPPSSDGQQSQVSDFPTTPGAFSETNLSPRCSNASFKFSFGNLNRKPELKEEWFTVTATDTIDLWYSTDDPDGDTIIIQVDSPNLGMSYFVKFTKDHIILPPVNGATQGQSQFVFNPDCSLIGDT